MVENMLSPDRMAIRSWFMQRVTSLILGAYFIFLFIYFLIHPQFQFTDWQALFAHAAMRFFSFFALLSLVYHSWIGIWTVLTDYVKPFSIRLTLEAILIFALLIYLVWGIEILWGV